MKKCLAPEPVGSQSNSTSQGVSRSADAADSMVANDIVTRVDAGRSSSEDAHPNSSELIGDPPSMSQDIVSEVAALKAQVGELADMFRAHLAQQSLATPPPSLSAASTSPEAMNARQRENSNDSHFSSFEMVESSSGNPLGSTKPGAVSPLPVSALASDKTGVEAETQQSDRDLPGKQFQPVAVRSNSKVCVLYL